MLILRNGHVGLSNLRVKSPRPRRVMTHVDSHTRKQALKRDGSGRIIETDASDIARGNVTNKR